MNVVKEIERINQAELDLGIQGGDSASWHAKYKGAYVFVGGLDYGLTEGDLIKVFSQYGEVVDCNLCRNKETGKPLGFAFLAYEDARSTILAVDNMNGAKIVNRIVRCDHAEKYRRPKKKEKEKDPKDDQPDFDEEEDSDYDERRRRIWDYEAYQTQADIRQSDAAAKGSSTSAVDAAGVITGVRIGEVGALAGDDARASRIMDQLKKNKEARKRKNALEAIQESDRMGGKKTKMNSNFGWGAPQAYTGDTKPKGGGDRDQGRDRGRDREPSDRRDRDRERSDRDRDRDRDRR